MYARYTEYLRDIMRNELSRPLLDKALSTYPLYSNPKAYDLIPTREQLNKKLLDHWKYHEIGFETVGRFLDELEITMCEIMPRYNELFKTIVTMAELPSPFDNVDIVETFEQERHDTATAEGSSSSNQSATGNTSTTNDTTHTGNTSEETSGSSTSEGSENNNQTTNEKHIKVDTPQNALTIPAERIDTLDYATEGSWDKSTVNGNGSTSGSASNESTSERSSRETSKTTASSENESTASESGSTSSSSESTGTTKHTYTKKGNQGVNTYAHDMNEFRTSIIDVVDQIISDLRIAELFMMVY